MAFCLFLKIKQEVHMTRSTKHVILWSRLKNLCFRISCERLNVTQDEILKLKAIQRSGLGGDGGAAGIHLWLRKQLWV